jgi:hypothetical protein
MQWMLTEKQSLAQREAENEAIQLELTEKLQIKQ